MKVYGTIYMIRNKINNKIYFGQTINNRGFVGRYGCARDIENLKNKTHNEHLKSSSEKYGIKNFIIKEVFDIAYSQEELDALEKMYIKIYKTTNPMFGYNKTMGGSSGFICTEEVKQKMSEARKGLFLGCNNPMFGKKHTDETKNKIREVWSKRKEQEDFVHVWNGKKHTDEAKEKISKSKKELYKNSKHPFQGRKHSDETLEKMRKVKLGKKASEETKRKMSEARKKQPRKKVMCLNTKEVFDSLELVLNKYPNASLGGIRANCVGKTNSSGKDLITGEKLMWSYVE